MERISSSPWRLTILLLALATHLPTPARSKLPLHQEPDIGQTTTPVAGCILGGKSYKLEEKWSLEMEEADMKYCVKCTCFPVTKVRMGRTYLSGKVSCRNIRKCPRQTCESPGGLCCSTCRRLVYSNEPFWKQDKAEFSALLVGSQLNQAVLTDSVAIADISVYDSSLYYSIRHTRLKQPERLLFVLEHGNILHQVHITPPLKPKICWNTCSSLPQVCGVWRRLPVLYQQYLRNKQVSIVLTTSLHPDGEVKGRIVASSERHRETFTTVLAAPTMEGAGGRVNFYVDPTGYTLYYNITLEHAFTGSNKAARMQGRVTVSIGYNRKTVFIDWLSERAGIIKGIWMKLKKRTVRQLTRGKLTIKISTQSTKTFSGRILPRLTCGAFQAVLSSSEVTSERRPVAGIGSAVFNLRQNGKIDYKIGVKGMDKHVRQINIERGMISGSSGSGTSTRRRRRKRSGNSIMKHFHPDAHGYDGWANGTYRKPKLKDIHFLLDEMLYIKVSIDRRRSSALRGHIIEVPYHERSHLFSGFPIVVRPRTTSIVKHRGSGYAWLAVDSGCQFHYQVLLDDMTASLDQPVSAYLARYNGHINSPLTSAFTSMIGNFHNNIVSGTITAISEELFKALDTGNATLRIVTGKHPSGVLEASVSIPNRCWRLAHDVSGIDSLLVGVTDLDSQQRTRCQFESHWYEDGETWAPRDVNSCKTCGCERGQVRCQWVLCPQLSCSNPVHIEGQCCPVCPALEQRVRMSIKQNITCFFEADQRWHPAWTVWYPFLHPFGYSTCALCSCLIGKNAWDCTPRACPPLTCTATANKFNMSHCCPVCSDNQKTPDTSSDTALALNDKNMEGACNFQKQVYQNGSQWFSNVMLLGEPHCGTCVCLDRKPKCRWSKCPKLKCKPKVRNKNSCCFRCLRKRKRMASKSGRKKH